METLNLQIGKVYSPQRIIKELKKFPDQDVKLQITISDNKKILNPKHLYHIDIDKLENLDLYYNGLSEYTSLKEIKEIRKQIKLKEIKKPKKNIKTKEIHVKINLIYIPCKNNFAYRLLMSKEIQEYIKKTKETKRGFLIETNDLDKHECKSSMGNATKCLNCVMSKNDMEEFKATPFIDRNNDYKGGKNRHYIRISYQGTVNKEEIKCEVE